MTPKPFEMTTKGSGMAPKTSEMAGKGIGNGWSPSVREQNSEF
jgi:hypothetical protein